MIRPLLFSGLYQRLALALFASFLVITVFSVVMLTRSSRAYQQEITQRMHHGLASYVVDHYLLFNKGKPDLAAVEQSFHDLMILGPNFEFYLLDTEGNILAYSSDPAKIKRQQVALTPLQNFIEPNNKTEVVRGTDPRSLNRRKVFSAAPIVVDNQLRGYLYVVLGSEIFDDIASMVNQSQLLQWGLWLFMAGLAFSFMAMLALAGWIFRPLSQLTSQIKSLQLQGFDDELKTSHHTSGPIVSNNANQQLHKELGRWKNSGGDEITTLASAFAALLEKLNQQYANVVTIDQLRKELLSHVSHDLRTPLASLLGYLETWELNRDNLSPSQSADYIATARKSAQTISKLVEQLFELAHLDSENVQVTREPFSLPELVQDVLQKFKIIAEAKNISLAVEPKDSTIRVVGDIEKIERVFSNLLENAIRHSKEGGAITVRFSKESRFVAVEVKDTGIGIPASDLPHVFDSHYKAGNSVRGNSAHGGLGLAITQKLLALHQSSIRVNSAVDVGTSFQFELEAAK